jgi:YHS domain-containing protein
MKLPACEEINWRLYPAGTDEPRAPRRADRGEPMVTDPVCKMQIDENKAAGKSEYKGKTYYFCAPVCKRKFDENPERYAGQ